MTDNALDVSRFTGRWLREQTWQITPPAPGDPGALRFAPGRDTLLWLTRSPRRAAGADPMAADFVCVFEGELAPGFVFPLQRAVFQTGGAELHYRSEQVIGTVTVVAVSSSEVALRLDVSFASPDVCIDHAESVRLEGDVFVAMGDR